jgi:hypothetical protein
LNHLESIVLGPDSPLPPVFEQAAAVESLPPGATLLAERARRRFSFAASVPVSYDLAWPTQSANGEVRGKGAVRVWAASPARVQYEVEADVLTTVRATARSAVLLSVFAAPGGTANRVAASALLSPPAPDDPLLAALLCRHPLDWMRSLMHGVGSPAWALMAREAQVWPAELDRLMILWRELSSGAESALWRMAGDSAAFDDFREWSHRLAGAPASEETAAAVRAELARDPRWAASPAAEWLEASAGVPLPLIDSPAARHRLHAAAGLALKLFSAGLDLNVIASLSAMAEASLGEDRLGAAIAAPTAEIRRHSSPLERLCRDIHAEAQTALGPVAASAAGRMIAACGAHWPLAEAAFDLARPGAVERFHAALAGRIEAFAPSPDGVQASPSLLGVIAARPLNLSVGLPLVPYRRLARVLETIDEASVQPVHAGRLEVVLPGSPADPARASSNSIVERVTLSPFRSLSREPGAAESLLACEDIFVLGGGAPAHLWRSLLNWLALPSAHCSPEPLLARLTISIPLAWAEIWHELPHSRNDYFLPVFAAISTSIQRTMRKWIPYLGLKDPCNYADPLAALPLLVYAVSRPFYGSRKGAFTYPLRGAAGLREAFQSALPGFAETTAAIHGELLAAGHSSHRSFNPARARTLLGTVYRQRRRFASLLAADAFFVEEILHLADTAHELRSLASSPRFAAKVLFRALESSRATLARRFRRLYEGRQFPILPSVLWIEATAAACRAMGAQAQVAATLTLEYKDGSAVFSNAAAAGRE